jgi:hypothetical protein
VPMPLVVWLTVEEVVVVAAAPIPVVAPRRVKKLTGAPVIVGNRGRRLGVGHACRSDTE